MSSKPTSMAQRFYLFLFLFFVVGVVAWGFLAVRTSVEEQRRGTSSFLAESREHVSQILASTASGQARLMDQAVQQLSANLEREFEDIPFDVFEGRDDLLLDFLVERLEKGRLRNEENSQVIAGLFRQESIDLGRREFDALESAQTAAGEVLAKSLQRDLLLWGGAFLAGIGVLIGLVFHRGVVLPLSAATQVIESMGAGDLAQRIPESESEEINKLALTFNKMADEIASQHRNLEERVEQKTAELRDSLSEQKRTNETLRATVDQLESTQAQLVESEKMAALGTMAKGMAHEFNNILGGISGLAEDLAQDVEDEDSKQALAVIQKTSRRALVITENLLRFSRGTPHSKSQVDLGEVVEQSAALLEPEASKRRIEIKLKQRSLSPIVTDGRGLQQVFLNLLINALHASEDGVFIEIEMMETEQHQTVSIRDHGRGIPQGDLARIFEPFFSTKAQEDGPGGTGLGLSVARGIVEKIGGTLAVKSGGVGLGSEFLVQIPKEES